MTLPDKSRSILLLVFVFAANWIETQAEAWINAVLSNTSFLGLRLAASARWLEGNAPEEFDNYTNNFAAYGYSVAYFIVFPMLAVGMAFALARRENSVYLRVFSRSIALNYLLSLPFYIFYPIPERWIFPESGATLLSDRISSQLIEIFRPLSGLDNSFPSAHVSITIIVLILACVFHMRYRYALLSLGATVILSTYALGIHWVADIVAGVALGGFSSLAVLALEIRPSQRATASV